MVFCGDELLPDIDARHVCLGVFSCGSDTCYGMSRSLRDPQLPLSTSLTGPVGQISSRVGSL